MTMLFWLFAALAMLGAAWWAWSLAALVRMMRAVPVMAKLTPPAPDRWPAVSVIIPARNEADTIEAALATRLADDYPDLELVLIDDRGDDATGAIIDRLAASDARVKARHVDALPDGWLGKVHAMERGREAARGEWLLFSDADVHVAPDALRRTVAWCEAEGVDHLAVVPDLWPSGFFANATLSAFARLFAVGGRFWQVRNPRSRVAPGVGAFNLVRRAALDRTPGFDWLRLEVVDDVALGQMLKRGGARCAMANGRGLVGLHYYRSVGEMMRGMEKNVPGAFGYRFGALALAALTPPVIEWASFAALAAAGRVPWLAAVGGAAAVLSLATSSLAAAWLRRPWASSLLSPIGTLLMGALMLRAGLLALHRGGVRWRDTFYPLAALRAGSRLRFP